MLSLQEARNAYEVIDLLTPIQKLALLSVAGVVKTKYSEQILKPLERFLEPDGNKLNRLGQLVVITLRQKQYAKEKRQKRERNAAFLQRLGSKKGRGNQEKHSDDRHLQTVDRWEESE